MRVLLPDGRKSSDYFYPPVTLVWVITVMKWNINKIDDELSLSKHLIYLCSQDANVQTYSKPKEKHVFLYMLNLHVHYNIIVKCKWL